MKENEEDKLKLKKQQYEVKGKLNESLELIIVYTKEA